MCVWPTPVHTALLLQLHGLETKITIDGEEMFMMFKADGELTTRTHKSGGGLSYEHEIKNLNKYKQIRMETMESQPDGSLLITSTKKADGSVETLALGSGDFVVFATGQRNGEWQLPRMERGLVVAHQITPTGPLNAMPIVGIALDHLRGSDTTRIDALKVRCEEFTRSQENVMFEKTNSLRGGGQDLRGRDGQLTAFMHKLNMDLMLTKCRHDFRPGDGNTYTFPQDVMYMRQWVEEWYARPLDVMEVLTACGWEPNWRPQA